MKTRLICCALALALAGCATARLPHYIKDRHPYERVFYAGYEETVKAVNGALIDAGWSVVETTDPAIYEYGRDRDALEGKQILIFTETKKAGLAVNSKLTKLNVYVRKTSQQSTTVEIRYVGVSSIPYKRFFNYRNDKLIEKLFEEVEESLS